MSRELKFRCWNKCGKCWITFGCDRYCFDNGVLDIMDDSDLLYEQYTGLKDKNGKEIYEGDIITIDWQTKPKFELVKWREAGFDPFQNGCRECWTPDGEEVEVIGNIHENPELLGDEK